MSLATSAAAQDDHRADALFDEARALMGAGRFGEACPKLAEAMSRSPNGRTKLALAMCHEGDGKLATALTEFREALSQATGANRADRIELANAHIRSIESRVSRCMLLVQETPGLSVDIDGVAITRDQWGASLPLDAGVHVVRATAPQHKPWETTIRVSSAGDFVRVPVPELESATMAHLPSPTPTPQSGHTSLLPWILLGGGITAVGVGSYFGVSALGKQSDSDRYCRGSVCDAPGVALVDEAKDHAIVADVALGIGVVALGVSAYLLLRDGTSSKQTARTVGVAW
jgi:hypothetical protein